MKKVKNYSFGAFLSVLYDCEWCCTDYGTFTQGRKKVADWYCVEPHWDEASQEAIANNPLYCTEPLYRSTKCTFEQLVEKIKERFGKEYADNYFVYNGKMQHKYAPELKYDTLIFLSPKNADRFRFHPKK